MLARIKGPNLDFFGGATAFHKVLAASNKRDHPTRSISSSPLVSKTNCSPGSLSLLEVSHKDVSGSLYHCLFAPHRNGCYSSRTPRSWWWIVRKRNWFDFLSELIIQNTWHINFCRFSQIHPITSFIRCFCCIFLLCFKRFRHRTHGASQSL